MWRLETKLEVLFEEVGSKGNSMDGTIFFFRTKCNMNLMKLVDYYTLRIHNGALRNGFSLFSYSGDGIGTLNPIYRSHEATWRIISLDPFHPWPRIYGLYMGVTI